MNETPLLECHGLNKRFGGIAAVVDVDLVVAAGSIVSVVGPNGAGKTTLFNTISGLYRPDSGAVRLAGTDITGWSSARVAAAGIARTFQQIRVFGGMTVLDNVLLGGHRRLRLRRGRRKGADFSSMDWLRLPFEVVLAVLNPSAAQREERELRLACEELIAHFGERLTTRRLSLAATLSYANRRRTEVARALALAPRLLLLDEPTAGMNPAETLELTEEIRWMRGRGITILLIEHKLDMVMSVSDRVIVMNHGSVIAEGDPDTVRRDRRVIEAYLGGGTESARRS